MNTVIAMHCTRSNLQVTQTECPASYKYSKHSSQPNGTFMCNVSSHTSSSSIYMNRKSNVLIFSACVLIFVRLLFSSFLCTYIIVAIKQCLAILVRLLFMLLQMFSTSISRVRVR